MQEWFSFSSLLVTHLVNLCFLSTGLCRSGGPDSQIRMLPSGIDPVVRQNGSLWLASLVMELLLYQQSEAKAIKVP